MDLICELCDHHVRFCFAILNQILMDKHMCGELVEAEEKIRVPSRVSSLSLVDQFCSLSVLDLNTGFHLNLLLLFIAALKLVLSLTL